MDTRLLTFGFMMFDHMFATLAGLFPCGTHVFSAGERTARGMAGGLNGVVFQSVGPD